MNDSEKIEEMNRKLSETSRTLRFLIWVLVAASLIELISVIV